MGYAIACGHELTAAVAEEVLRAGGTALDAAIAAYTTSWITEPCMSGPGGGGLAIIGQGSSYHTIDFFCKTPKVKRPAPEVEVVPITVDFGGATDVFHVGQGAVAVPGAVEGVFTMHAMGARMPMRELLQPAIEIARQGHPLDPFQHYDLVLLKDIQGRSQRGRELFFDGDEIKPVGSSIVATQLADFLDFLGREGRDAFYRGEIASHIAAACDTQGGHVTTADLEAYSAVVEKPLQREYGGYSVLLHRNPGIGSWLLARTIEHTKELVGNGLTMPDALLEAIRTARAARSELQKAGFAMKAGGTSHLSIVDERGDMVSLSMSIGEGSGCYIAGTDIQLNNMLGEMDLLPDGLHNWYTDMRMQTMMSPALCLSVDEDTRFALGSGGSTRIPFVIAQVMHHIIAGMTPEEAVATPRAHMHDGIWQVEPGFRNPAGIPPEQWNVWKETNLYFGGVHTAMQTKHGWLAAADARRYGAIALSN